MTDGGHGTDESTDNSSDVDTGDGDPGIHPRDRRKSALLWTVIGALAFLVVSQGYLLLGGDVPFGYAGLFPLAGVVGVALGVTSYLFEPRLLQWGR